jgi:glycerophosphoryl diester phosphodiesterase
MRSLSFSKAKLAFACIFLLSLQALSAAATTNQTMSKVEKLFAEKRPLVIGHRGFPAVAPENTLASFAYGVKAGADMVELDYHHTSDGKMLVIHDYEADRTTDAKAVWKTNKVRVQDHTAAELQKLDAGSRFKPSFPGQKLPLLEEALELIQRDGVTLIERKAGDPQTCIDLLRQRDWINQAMVQAFDWDYLTEFHKLEPRQILGALGPSGSYGGKKLSPQEKELSPLWNDRAKATGARAVVWNAQVNAEAVKDAHAKGLKVWVYTIDDPKKANELLDMGVDGLITNNTSLIWRALALRAARRQP